MADAWRSGRLARIPALSVTSPSFPSETGQLSLTAPLPCPPALRVLLLCTGLTLMHASIRLVMVPGEGHQSPRKSNLFLIFLSGSQAESPTNSSQLFKQCSSHGRPRPEKGEGFEGAAGLRVPGGSLHQISLLRACISAPAIWSTQSCASNELPGGDSSGAGQLPSI